MHRVLLIDCDGVLTDGRLHIDHTGTKLFKSFHTRDIRALRELCFNGYEVVIVSCDDWEGGKCFAQKVGAEFVNLRDKSNVAQLFKDYLAVGDDAWDVPLLKGAAEAFAPCDADPVVLKLPFIRVLPCKGGEGVIAELVRHLIK